MGLTMSKLAITLRSLRAFAAVGILATLVHYVILEALLKTGAIPSLALANAIGYCSALVVSYTGNRYFVFDGKRGHLDGFFILVIGYLLVLALHTGLILGLTGGQIISTLEGPLAPVGGSFLTGIWYGLLDTFPAGLTEFLIGDNRTQLSTTPAFLAASGTAAVVTYFWNRLVVFQIKPAQLPVA